MYNVPQIFNVCLTLTVLWCAGTLLTNTTDRSHNIKIKTFTENLRNKMQKDKEFSWKEYQHREKEQAFNNRNQSPLHGIYKQEAYREHQIIYQYILVLCTVNSLLSKHIASKYSSYDFTQKSYTTYFSE